MVGEWITVADPTDRGQLPTPPRILPPPAPPIIHAATDTPAIKRLAKKYPYLLIAQATLIDSAAKTRVSLRRAQDHSTAAIAIVIEIFFSIATFQTLTFVSMSAVRILAGCCRRVPVVDGCEQLNHSSVAYSPASNDRGCFFHEP